MWNGIDMDRMGDGNGTGPSAVYNNTIVNIWADSQVQGIALQPITGNFSAPAEVHGNIINDLRGGAATFNYDCAGIYAIAGLAGLNIYSNKITNIAMTNSRTATGLLVTSTGTAVTGP